MISIVGGSGKACGLCGFDSARRCASQFLAVKRRQRAAQAERVSADGCDYALAASLGARRSRSMVDAGWPAR
jgi:hypothetical protein